MPTPRQQRNQPPINVNDLQHGTFPGDTVVVHDPPPSNMGTQDSYGDEKGIKAPPGNRGEYVERPRGNLGGPGGSIGVDPMKYKVDYDDSAKRNQIPPMFLPAAAKEEIDNEDEPADDAGGKRVRKFEQDLLVQQPPAVQPVAPAPPVAEAPPDVAPPPKGTGLGFKDFFSQVTRGEFGMSDVPWEPLLPLEGLEPFLDNYVQAAGNFASHIAKSIPTFQEVQLKTGNSIARTLPPGSRVLDVGASEGNWGKAISALSKGAISTVALDPNPDMKNTFDSRFPTSGATYEMKSFQEGFDDPTLGRIEPLMPRGDFDVVHESMAFQFISPDRAGQIAEMKRHLKPGGIAMVEEKVFNDAWEQNERKKDAEYKARYFAPAALKEKDKMVGFQQSKGETGTVGMLDNMVSQQALEAALAANFAYVIQYWDSGNFKGYAASDDLKKLESVVNGMQSTTSQFSTVETPRMVGGPRRAFNVYPVPSEPRQLDERLLLQIPHDVQERYTDLTRRVSDYAKNVKLNALDMYSFPSDPPEKWVEEERGNVQVDWDDRDAWASYMGRLSHDDVADWIGLESFDEGRLAALAPGLTAQHALETGGTQDFSSWFRARRPAIEDRELHDYIQGTARTFPSHGLGRGFSGYWRRRNHEMVREIATQRARDRHDRYLREVDYANHVKPNYRDTFDKVVQSREKHMPLSEVVNSLHSLPVDGEDRDKVDGFRNEYDSLVNEGMHALDFQREPVSRDDRLFGDMEYQGERWVPTRKIEGVDRLQWSGEPGTGDIYRSYDVPAGPMMVELAVVIPDPAQPSYAPKTFTRADVLVDLDAVGLQIEDLEDEYYDNAILQGVSRFLGFSVGWMDNQWHRNSARHGGYRGTWQRKLDLSRRSKRRTAKGIENIDYPESHQLGMKVPKGGSSCAGCVHVSDDKTECGEKHFVKWNGGHKLPEPADEYCCDFFKAKGRTASAIAVALYQYGDRYFLVHESDRQHLDDDMLMVRAQVYRIIPGSSIAKRAMGDWHKKSSALAGAIREIKGGADREATFMKYGRDYGPGLRKAISDYLFVTSNHTADGGGGASGSSFGDSTCSSFEQQTPDNCKGCTFSPNMGGNEFGYGDGGCLLSQLFINAPQAGFGRGEQNAYDPEHTPATPTVQTAPRDRRRDPRLP